jgi:hypothetical protein
MVDEQAVPGGPVTAEDVELAVRLAVEALAGADGAGEADWSAKAGSLEWDCRETADHLIDDLFSYAAQLGPRQPSLDTYVPFGWAQARPGAPGLAVYADPEAGTAGRLVALEAAGALLAAMVRTRPATLRSFHTYGVSDPEGFAAMGVVETLAHLQDLAEGLGFAWAPPAGLCRRVLDRLFPDAPTDTDPWPTLRWATGRGELPGRARLTEWRWDGTLRR